MKNRRFFTKNQGLLGVLKSLIVAVACLALVTCDIDNGETGNSEKNFVLATPSAPVLKISDRLFTVQWTAVEGAESYNVYLSTEQSPPANPVKTVTETVALLDGLTNKTVYYVWIKAVSKSGTSDFSPASRGIPWSPYDPPATPERPIIVSGIYQLTISWEECGGADYYVWYISQTSEGLGVGTTTTTTSVVIRNLEGGTVYYVRIRAVNSRGQISGDSPIEVGQPRLPTAVPASPAITLVIARDQELSVTWQAVEGARTYQIWLGTTVNSAGSKPHLA